MDAYIHPLTTNPSECLKARRRSRIDRMVAAQLASMGDTVGDTVGQGTRQQLVWLGLLAMPLLYAAGAVDGKEAMRCFNTNFQGGSIAMRSVVWG